MAYDKQADIRDRQAAEWIKRDFDCSNYTDKHLSNALKFALGCAGSESRERALKLRRESNKRKNTKSLRII